MFVCVCTNTADHVCLCVCVYTHGFAANRTLPDALVFIFPLFLLVLRGKEGLSPSPDTVGAV